MSNQGIRFSLKYTLTGFAAGIFIVVIIFIIIVNSAHILLNAEAVSGFFAEHNLVAFILFLPAFITTVIGYVTDLNINNLIRSKEIEFEETKQHTKYIYNFIEKLRKGESVQKLTDLPEDDKIIQSLINLSEEIKKRQEEEDKRKKEDAQRSKTSEGLAYFGSVLREHNNTIEELTQTVTNELVKYVDAYQAAFYLIDESSEFKIIKEVANYASGKKRFAAKELLWGEGLPGACILEKKTNYLNKISDNYLEIESGLGSAKPSSILIVPVVTQEGVIHGALELASFKEYEEYEIAFIEQVAENTAMTISTLKINEETAILLKESREQASALSNREDELQKTISEMRRLQENADIQSADFRAYQDSTNKALIRAEYSNEGKLLFANKKFLKLFEYKSNSEIENESILKFVNSEDNEWFNQLKNSIFQKNTHFEGLLKHITKSGKTVWIESSYIGLRNEKGKTEKILFLGIDTTKLKTDILNLDLRVNQLNNALFTADFQINGEIIDIGKKLLTQLNYKKDDLESKLIYDLLSESSVATLKNTVTQITDSGVTYEGEIEFINNENNISYFYGIVIPEKDINDNINSIKILVYDYSQQINFADTIKEQEALIQTQEAEIIKTKERMNRRVEQVREDMRELYIETETAYIFSHKTFELLPFAVVTIDKDNKLTVINDSAFQLFGIKDEKLIGKDIKTLLPEIENKSKGIYLGDIFTVENEDFPTGEEKTVYFIDNKGKTKYLKLLLIRVSVGLRQQLTALLRNV